MSQAYGFNSTVLSFLQPLSGPRSIIIAASDLASASALLAHGPSSSTAYRTYGAAARNSIIITATVADDHDQAGEGGNLSCSYIPMTKTKLRKAATAGAAAARQYADLR